ncbi:hypothetical protein [uncultured Chryseobacterium sp.]|uniref:hypothetical protein n=1 Tax=uncultured Chryseobacterium sp. TaxID=259322 RepID=UPI0025D3073F|nr:hypothetical protein [uncultured Chryseobacterium sp.]
MTRLNKNSLITVIIITVITLYRFVFPSENGDDYKDKIREKEIKSIVSKKYIDCENHGIPYIVYGRKDSIIIYRDWEDKIDVGDSIIKPKGSLELIFRNLNKLEQFSYDNQDLKLPSP